MVRASFPSVFALWMALAPAVHAERWLTPNQSVRIDYFEVDRDEVIKLVVTPSRPLHEVDLRKEIGALMESGKAALFGTVEAKSTNSAAMVGVHREYLYPTERDPPEVPHVLRGPIEAGVDLLTPDNPAAYDMRTLGPWLTIRPHKDSDFPAHNIHANWTFLRGHQVFGRGIFQSRAPVFYGMRSSAILAERPDKDILLGVFTPPPASLEEIPREHPRRIIALLHQSGDSTNHEPPKKGTGQNVGILVTYASIPWDRWLEVRKSGMTESELWHMTTGENSPARIIEMAYATGILKEKTNLTSTYDWPRRGSGDPAEIPQTLHGPIDPEVEFITHVGVTSMYIDRVGHTLEFRAVGMRQKDVYAVSVAPELLDFAGTAEFGKSYNAKTQTITATPITSTQELYLAAGQTSLLAMTRAIEPGGDKAPMILTFVRLDSFPP